MNIGIVNTGHALVGAVEFGEWLSWISGRAVGLVICAIALIAFLGLL